MDQRQQDMGEIVYSVGVILPKPALVVEEAEGIIWKGFLSRYDRGFLPHTIENCWCREESLREEVLLYSLTKDWWYPVLVGKLDFYYYVTVMGLPNLFLRKDSFNF